MLFVTFTEATLAQKVALITVLTSYNLNYLIRRGKTLNIALNTLEKKTCYERFEGYGPSSFSFYSYLT